MLVALLAAAAILLLTISTSRQARRFRALDIALQLTAWALGIAAAVVFASNLIR